MTTRTAIRILAPGTAQVQSDVPVPRLRPDYIIAEPKAWALNPTDIAHVDYLSGSGTISGCDWAGVVTAVGQNVTRFKPGDAVYGACHGGNTVEPEDGSFASVITSKESGTLHKPDSLSFAEAASLGVGLATIGQALYHIMKLRLPVPRAGSEPTDAAVFVYGGSTATGTLAIQAAKLSGYTVYTTCSPTNFDLVKSRGADAWFDYNHPRCIEDALAAAAARSSSIGYILDCIGNEQSGRICAGVLGSSAIGSGQAHYHTIKPPVPESFTQSHPTVTATTALAYAMTGESFEMPPGVVYPADTQLAEFAQDWVPLVEGLVAQGQIRPHPVDVRGGGLETALRAMGEMRENGPRGRKIVCVE